MGIIIRFALKNIRDKKLRTFLIVLSILLSAAVFFASNAISDTVMRMFTDSILGYYGSSDIAIESGYKAPSPYFTARAAGKYLDKMEYLQGEMSAGASFQASEKERLFMDLRGIDDLSAFSKVTEYTLLEEGNLHPFTGKKLIIGKNTALRYDLQLGQKIELDFMGKKHKFEICAIAEPGGAFPQMDRAIFAMAPRDELCSINHARGKVNRLLIKLKNPADKPEMLKLLSSEYKQHNVREPFSQEELKRMTQDLSMTFMMLSIVVFFMSMFIIYTSFKVITMERLPVIGTFRSIGATRRVTGMLLLLESILYGLIGGVLGSCLGIGLLHIMAFAVGQMFSGNGSQIIFTPKVSFNPQHVAVSIFMAVVLCFVSSLLPILKISRIPVKDIVLNTIQKPKKKGKLRLISGLISLAVILALSLIRFEGNGNMTAALAMFLCPVSVVLLVPYLTAAFVRLFEVLYVFIFGNIGALAAKNLRENKNILNNISLLAIGISSLLMINIASYDSTARIMNSYKDASFGLRITAPPQEPSFRNKLLNADGVKSAYCMYQTYIEEVNGQARNGLSVTSLNGPDFFDYWRLDTKEDPQKLFEELNSGRTILLTTTLKERFKVEKGDMLKLKIGNSVKQYRVVGFVRDILGSDYGSLVAEKYVKADMGMRYFYTMYVNTDKEPATVKQSLQDRFGEKQFKQYNTRVETQQEIIDSQLAQNQQSVVLIAGFAVLAMIIGVFGIVNNLIISFIERRHSLAVFRSMGMSRPQSICMIFIESATGGLIGSMAGILGGVLMVFVMAGATESSRISYPFGTMVWFMIGGMAVSLVASISPAMKSSRMDLVAAIKFE